MQNCHFKNTGDDGYVLWGADLEPENVTFRDSTIINTGILRPNWYGVCIATYEVKSVVFQNITCRSPTHRASGFDARGRDPARRRRPGAD